MNLGPHDHVPMELSGTLNRMNTWSVGGSTGVDTLYDIAHNIVMRPAKLLPLARRGPHSLRFSDLCRLAEAFGFVFQRQKGSHRVYAHDGIRQIMNFQNDRGTAKAYQVRQLLDCIDRNGLAIGSEEHD